MNPSITIYEVTKVKITRKVADNGCWVVKIESDGVDMLLLNGGREITLTVEDLIHGDDPAGHSEVSAERVPVPELADPTVAPTAVPDGTSVPGGDTAALDLIPAPSKSVFEQTWREL